MTLIQLDKELGNDNSLSDSLRKVMVREDKSHLQTLLS